MNRLLTFLGFAAIVYGFSACDCNCPKDQTGHNNTEGVLNSPQRAGMAAGAGNAFFTTMRQKSQRVAEIQRSAELMMSNLPKTIDLKSITINSTKGKNSDMEASSLVMTIFNSLVKAEGSDHQLDLQFSMSDKPVQDGLFLFALQTPQEFKGTQDLVLQMFNEETFEMVAHNSFKITPGNNYKVLNVKEFDPGTYIFRLSDGSDSELLRRVQINSEVN